MRTLPFLLLIACVDGPGSERWALVGSYEQFVDEVQPVLERGCANPSCHGVPDRPLEVYAVHQHRLDPADVYLDAPLSEEELWHNFLRACGFATEPDTVADCALLRKPLAPDAGGSAHEGGIQYGDIDNPDYQALRRWVAGEEEP